MSFLAPVAPFQSTQQFNYMGPTQPGFLWCPQSGFSSKCFIFKRMNFRSTEQTPAPGEQADGQDGASSAVGRTKPLADAEA